MYLLSRFCIFVLLLTTVVSSVFAQEDLPPAGRGGRGGGNTRDFLGLGPPPDAAAASRGEKLYAPNCSFCHGEKARGAEGPNLVRSPLVLHDEKGELIGATITKGFPDKGMPAFSNFTEGQLFDISQYLHMQVELVANRGIYKRLNVVTGDAQSRRGLLQRLRRLQGLPLRDGRFGPYRKQIPGGAVTKPIHLARRQRRRRRIAEAYGDAAVGRVHHWNVEGHGRCQSIDVRRGRQLPLLAARRAQGPDGGLVWLGTGNC